MKRFFILVFAFYAKSAMAQTEPNIFPSTGNAGIGVTTPGNRLTIQTTDTTKSNMISLVHAGIQNSNFNIGTASKNYVVVSQRSANLLESYRDLRIGAALSGNIFFETGRTSAASPDVRMIIANNGNIGIGTETPAAKLHVSSPGGDPLAWFTSADVSAANGFIKLTNGTSTSGAFYPAIIGRTQFTGRSFGLAVVGEAEDVLPASDATVAAITIQGRSKTATPLTVNNILAVNNLTSNLMIVRSNGNVGIGVSAPAYKLAVAGTIGARKVKVTLEAWADFVFHDSYKLPSLGEVAAYVKEHKHLPGIPTTAEVTKDGVDLGEMNVKLLQKVEELTLYLIQMKEENEAMKARLKALETKK